MKPLPQKLKSEKEIQNDLIKFLRWREWVVMSTHGNAHQQGFPDIFCCHPRYSWRWVEVKKIKGYRMTAAQEKFFPIIKKVWILNAATFDEYDKLFHPSNWFTYLNPNHKSRIYRESDITSRDTNEDDIVDALEKSGWTVMRTHGNIYQKGFPDLYCIKDQDIRWVEVKNKSFRFTGAQLKYFPLMDACKVRIWILQNAKEIGKLDQPHNLRHYL